ncbi:hypothetical protein [Natrinema sp. 74]|uniref:hypothetical protein n=1 Tax=Natrinema sp. 74 TaxID=3384159 RepID=UPI0038D4307A
MILFSLETWLERGAIVVLETGDRSSSDRIASFGSERCGAKLVPALGGPLGYSLGDTFRAVAVVAVK